MTIVTSSRWRHNSIKLLKMTLRKLSTDSISVFQRKSWRSKNFTQLTCMSNFYLFFNAAYITPLGLRDFLYLDDRVPSDVLNKNVICDTLHWDSFRNWIRMWIMWSSPSVSRLITFLHDVLDNSLSHFLQEEFTNVFLIRIIRWISDTYWRTQQIQDDLISGMRIKTESTG